MPEYYEDTGFPRFTNDGDGAGSRWYRRGRWSGWYDLTEWLFGVQVHVNRGEYTQVVLRLGPLWIARESA